MEKSTNSEEIPRQTDSATLQFAIVGGFALFWACFFTMLMRNAFLDAGIEQLWYHLALRIAFFAGFGACAYVLAHVRDGVVSPRRRRIMVGLVVLFAAVAVVSSVSFALTGTPHVLAFDLVVWVVSGVGLCSLLFYWLPTLARVSAHALALCLALSVACGSALYLIVNLLPAPANVIMLAVCALMSPAVRAAVARDEADPDATSIPLGASKKNARLSWSFGIIYLVYGIVFGLGAGSVTRLDGGSELFGGIAAFAAVGAGAAFLFMRRFAGRMRQSDVLRLLFPVLVVSLVPMAFFTGTVYALCNLLLLASYVFLVVVSVMYELQTALKRQASPLFFVGMSQTALSGGLVVGFALGLLPSMAGTLDYAMLSAVALGLVVLLAVLITVAPANMPLDAESAEGAAEGAPETDDDHPEQGRWKARCATVARNAKLSARETEVFMLLAKGRGIEHIQNKLCISGHTVKTHTYNIYRKMGINSREELLDAIEAADPDAVRPT